MKRTVFVLCLLLVAMALAAVAPIVNARSHEESFFDEEEVREVMELFLRLGIDIDHTIFFFENDQGGNRQVVYWYCPPPSCTGGVPGWFDPVCEYPPCELIEYRLSSP